jgi:hypothetical protein
MPGMEQVAQKVRSYIEAFTEKGATGGYGFASKAAKENVSFSRLFEVRQALDDLVYRSEAATPTLKDAEMRKIRGIFQEELEQRGERVARQMGDDHFLTGAQSRQPPVSAPLVAQKAAGQAVEAQTANRAVGLTDHLVGLGSVVMGGGNPLLGVAGAIGNKALREKGNAFAANTLERFARGGGTAGLLEANHAAALQLDRVPSILDRLAAGERSPARATLPAHGLAALLNIGSARTPTPTPSSTIARSARRSPSSPPTPTGCRRSSRSWSPHTPRTRPRRPLRWHSKPPRSSSTSSPRCRARRRFPTR